VALVQQVAEREEREERATRSLLEHARGLHTEAKQLQTTLDKEQR